jgi:PAS domain S-box-containing protein
MRASATGPIRTLYVDSAGQRRGRIAASLDRDSDRFEVLTATDGETALSVLAAERPDCIVSAYALAGMDGLDLLGAVRERDPDLPFVLVPADGSEELASEAVAAGVTDYLPQTPEDGWTGLADRIEEAVVGSRAGGPARDGDRLAGLLGDVDDLVAVLDGDGVVRYASPAAEAVLGTDAGSVVHTPLREWVHPEDREAVTAACSAVRDGADSRTVEHRVETANGDPQRVETTVADRSDHRGVGGLVLTLRTTAERRRQERKIGRYETLLETLPVGVSVLDEEARIQWVNEAFWGPLEKTEEEIVGTPYLDLIEEGLIDPGIVDDYLDGVRTLLSSSGPDRITIEHEVYPPDEDGIREYEGYMALQPREDGEFAGTVNAFIDVTDRNRRQRELEQYRAAMETVPDGAFVLNEEGRMVRVNEAAAAISGHEPADLNGEPFAALVEEGVVGESAVESYLSLVSDLLSDDTDGIQGKFTVELTPPDDDREHTYEIHTGLLPTEEGEFRGVAGVIRDITEKVDRQRQLERENERLERFASIVSHDLRNPLNVATSSLDLAAETGERAHIDRARQAVDRMDELIEDLLTLARQGEAIDTTAPVDLGRVVEACWETVETGRADLAVTTGRTVRADEGRLKQLLENLLGNAVDHGGPGVTVTVGDTERGFYVADDGPGIPPDEREAVFGGGYSTAETGTGFGLAIVSEIVDAHGWTVSVTESEAGGARFEIVTEPS